MYWPDPFFRFALNNTIMKKNILALVLSVFTLSAMAQNVNTAESNVSFELSNMKWKTVEGTFTGMTGTVTIDPENLDSSSIDVCIDAATVNTGNEKRDDHLRNEDFFEVETYASICFTSTNIVKTETGYTAKGNLTMHGVTLAVEIPLSVDGKTVTGSLTVNRYDYKVGEGYGTFMIGDEVAITITCVLE